MSKNPKQSKPAPDNSVDRRQTKTQIEVLLMYVLPTAANFVVFWAHNESILWAMWMTGCVATGPVLIPLGHAYVHIAGPAVGFAILGVWVVAARFTAMRRLPPLLHLVIWCAWMLIGFDAVVKSSKK